MGYGGLYFLAAKGIVQVNIVPGARTLYDGQVSVEPVALEQIEIQLKERNIYYVVRNETIEIYPHGQGWGPMSFELSNNTVRAIKDIPGVPSLEKFKERVRIDVRNVGGIVTIKEDTWKIIKTTYPWTAVY